MWARDSAAAASFLHGIQREGGGYFQATVTGRSPPPGHCHVADLLLCYFFQAAAVCVCLCVFIKGRAPQRRGSASFPRAQVPLEQARERTRDIFFFFFPPPI